MKVVRLDELAPGRPEGVDWLPLRAALGITAFGASAYRANAGEPVVPAHAERPGGGAGVHEELYVVLSGRATFTVDGEALVAAQARSSSSRRRCRTRSQTAATRWPAS